MLLPLTVLFAHLPVNHSLPSNSIDSPALYNDIALLKTNRKIQFNDAVFPYCISSSPPAAGTTVIAAGFGFYNESKSRADANDY